MSDHDREQDLLAQAREGDEMAFAALCARHEGRLRARIDRRLNPRIQRKLSVQDVLQEAYLVAHRRLRELEDPDEEGFGRWLGRIVELKTREAVRQHVGTAKRDVRREVSGAGPAAGVQPPARSPSPSQMAIAGETREAASSAMARLPAHYAQVLTLIQGEGLTLAEAAERMGRTRDSVKGLYSRALAQLAADLGLDETGAPA